MSDFKRLEVVTAQLKGLGCRNVSMADFMDEYWASSEDGLFKYADIDFSDLDPGDQLLVSEYLDLVKDAKTVDSYGGEGQGDDYYAVIKFPALDNVLIKFQGWYASYHGSEFSEAFEVTPEVVEKTVYNRVKS